MNCWRSQRCSRRRDCVAWDTSERARNMLLLDALTDDLLRMVVRLGLSDYSDRHAFAKTCTRAAECVRGETTLWVDLTCGTSPVSYTHLTLPTKRIV